MKQKSFLLVLAFLLCFISTANAQGPTQSAKMTIKVKGVSFNMIRVEGGTFWMGAQNTNPSGQNYDEDADEIESPVHQEAVGTFYVAETEVTQKLWQAVMASNPSKFKGLQKPVEQVSWDDCQTFIEKLNALTGRKFRLPTEAEWEYAARGGNQSKGYKYAGGNTVRNVAWFDEDFDTGSTHPVKQKVANELGLYDMSGNVWEWCSDKDGFYSQEMHEKLAKPMTGSYRVFRGGSWCDEANRSRVSDRAWGSPYKGYSSNGLRLVLDPQ